MYLPQDDISEVVLRQRNKKDKLAEELCKNKAKVARLLKDLRILSQPFNTDIEAEMKDLDDEIEKLRRCCQDMSNSLVENSGNHENAITAEQRQPVRPAPPPPPQAPPRARPYNLFAGLPVPSPRSPLSPHSPASQHSQTPSPVCQAPSPDPQPQLQLQPKVIDENDGTDPNCGEQPWACSMCTFRNHPLLNKCEFCDNIRILSGTVRIVPSNPSVRPLLGLCSKSEPPTPATPASGPTSARLFTSLSADHNRPSMPSSTSESNLIQFTGDVLM